MKLLRWQQLYGFLVFWGKCSLDTVDQESYRCRYIDCYYEGNWVGKDVCHVHSDFDETKVNICHGNTRVISNSHESLVFCSFVHLEIVVENSLYRHFSCFFAIWAKFTSCVQGFSSESVGLVRKQSSNTYQLFGEVTVGELTNSVSFLVFERVNDSIDSFDDITIIPLEKLFDPNVVAHCLVNVFLIDEVQEIFDWVNLLIEDLSYTRNDFCELMFDECSSSDIHLYSIDVSMDVLREP